MKVDICNVFAGCTS